MTTCDKCGKKAKTRRWLITEWELGKFVGSDSTVLLCDSCAKPVIELLEKT